MFSSVYAGPSEAIEFFSDWKREVEASVPADRLLIYELKDGWGPLCEFLGLPEPDQPFPTGNETAVMNNNLRRAKLKAYLVVFGAPVMVGVVGYAVAKFWAGLV